ncbi:MAG TPA: DUF2905 domain-containing protein [Fimbriimonadaceae bacterium]|nr:DUF2905 domain-containing protein [Fimbriimonadaceae bacterium]
MANIGKFLVVAGIGVAALGAVLWGLANVFPGLKIGRLPGDIAIDNGNVKVYIPITTMVIVSLVVSGVLWLIGAFRK